MTKSVAPTKSEPTEPASSSAADSVSWMEADKEYSLGIDGGKLVCRNPKGKPLASVPKWLKESELAEQLLAVGEWLSDHRLECVRQVETWMLRSLPVPREVVLSVWKDPDWQAVLRNLVVMPLVSTTKTDPNQAGFLRDVEAKKGLGIVDRDGETEWIQPAQVMLPHPILIEGLDDFRELMADLQFTQSLDQLFRPVFAATSEQKKSTRLLEFQDGKFEQLNYATSLCRRLGYPVRGGYACCKVWENATPIEARYWVGDEYPEAETHTGELIFVDEAQEAQEIADVGAVTFSEGMRMATQIFAKRKVDNEEPDSE